jgi:hypothetical protein
MTSDGMINMISFIKIGSNAQEFSWGEGGIHIHTCCRTDYILQKDSFYDSFIVNYL